MADGNGGGEPHKQDKRDDERPSWAWLREGPDDTQLRRGAFVVGTIAVAVGQAVADGRLEPRSDAVAMTAATAQMQRIADRFVKNGRHDAVVRAELLHAIRDAAQAVVAVARGPERVPDTGRKLGPDLSGIHREVLEGGRPSR